MRRSLDSFTLPSFQRVMLLNELVVNGRLQLFDCHLEHLHG